jgi:hypothetical protein
MGDPADDPASDRWVQKPPAEDADRMTTNAWIVNKIVILSSA